MLTLCPLAAPVSVRFPEASPLRQFKFFMTRARESNSNAQPLNLHMGYFGSLAEAERWALALRPRYPAAVAARVPQSLLQQPNSGVPVLRAASPATSPASSPATSAAPIGRPAPTARDSKALTDTQVLRVLEARRDPGTQPTDEARDAAISLVAPDDTVSLRALKDAVAEGAPVSFAVQLLWSATDIDLASVPSLSIFRAYTLYKLTTTREGRTWHGLRLGFFKDALSAKQVAYYVRSHFVSVAVVPVTAPEQTKSAECRVDPSTLSDDFQRAIDAALDADRSRQKSPDPVAMRAPAAPAEKRPAARTPAPKAPKDSLEQTLEMLASSEMLNDEETHTETGVRHLKFEVRKASSR
jgi:hypothetical protein